MFSRLALLFIFMSRLLPADSASDPRVLNAERLIAQGNFAAAALEYEAVYHDAAQPGVAPGRLADADAGLGGIYILLDRYKDAEPRLQEAVEIDRREFGNDTPQAARHSVPLAKLYILESRLAEAERILLHARPLIERANGPYSRLTGSVYNSFGMLYEASGRLEQSADGYRRASDIYSRLGDSQQGMEGMALVNLASVLVDLNRLSEAGQTVEKALRLLEHTYGPDHLFTARALNGLGWVYHAQRHLEEARGLYERALAITTRNPGVGTLDAASVQASLGAVYTDLGYYPKAEALLRQALATRERALGPSSPEIVGVLNNLGVLYAHQGRWTDAEHELVRGEEIARNTNLCAARATPVLTNLGAVYYANGRYRKDSYAKSEALFRRYLSLQEERYGPDSVEAALALFNLAEACAAQKKYREARQFEGRAVAIRQAVLGPQHPDTIQARKLYTSLLHKGGE